MPTLRGSVRLCSRTAVLDGAGLQEPTQVSLGSQQSPSAEQIIPHSYWGTGTFVILFQQTWGKEILTMMGLQQVCLG